MCQYLTQMPRSTVTQRLRSTLKRLLDKEGHGAAARLAAFSANRPGGRKIRPQDLSYFKHGSEGRTNPLTLDDLDDIADYFRLSIGELFELKSKDLTGDEQRLLWNFRALPDVTREHFIALLESAAVATGFVAMKQRKSLRETQPSDTTTSREVYPIASEIPAEQELAQLREDLHVLSLRLGLMASGPRQHGSIPSLSPREPGGGGVSPTVERGVPRPHRRSSDKGA